MPLRLKSLELHGFKTFAAKTTFEFAAGITAIVGPNGSGKSNIADAIRWVLGEQSYGLLRAKKTEDVIFAGSEQRPRAGMAAVTILFDNADSWLPVDFSEVALTRRAYRDGHNEYLLNGQQVRLKDINELLAQSGLAERTYTILGQGLVDVSLALKADERRRLFEEAAGVGLYRARREEALRRLEATQRNLERVLDILAELEPRLKSLEKQARRAREYAQIRADLQLLLRDWYGYHWHRTQDDLTLAREKAQLQERRLQEAQQAYQSFRQQVNEVRNRLSGLRARLNAWHRQSAALHHQRQTLSRDLAVLEERQRSLEENLRTTDAQLSRVQEELLLSSERLSESQQEAERLQTEYEEAQEHLRTAQEALKVRVNERSQAEKRLQEARQHVEHLQATSLRTRTRLEELARLLEAQQQKLLIMDETIARAEAEYQAAEAEHQRAVRARREAEAEQSRAEEERQALLQQRTQVEAERKRKSTELATKGAERARLRAQWEVLEEAERALSGYAEGARWLLEAARQARLTGVRGVFSATLEVPAELETAIAAALGEYLDAILLESDQATEQAMVLLEGGKAARAALLPLDWLAPPEPIRPPHQESCLGIASELIQVPAELRPAVDLLLGQTLVVKDREAARSVLAAQPAYVRAVTLRGEVFSASGPALAGQPKSAPSLSRPRQRRELKATLAMLEKEIAQDEADLHHLDQRIEKQNQGLASLERALSEKRRSLEALIAAEREARDRQEMAKRRWEWEVNQKTALQLEIERGYQEQKAATETLSEAETLVQQAQEKVHELTLSLEALNPAELQQELAYWNTQVAVAERALSDAQTRREERLQMVNRLQVQLAELERKRTEIRQALARLQTEKEALRGQEGEIQTQLETLQNLIEPAEKELEAAEAQESALQSREAALQQRLTLIEQQHNQAQFELNRTQEALSRLRSRIEDDFGLVEFQYSETVTGPIPLPFEGMVQQLPTLTELPADLEENLNRQRALLRRMGPINPEAEQEYEAVKARYEFLSNQVQDLKAAEEDLRQVIGELDEITRQEFQKTFLAVAEEFHLIFRRLFGGGSARLILTDPDDLTASGIDIEARLPGRREQGLALLSGGERSLTAIALVFALLKVSPTPVCVMDEVDAMLDEANVGRFRDMLLELSQKTQFIIITHNRNTVQVADVIYGVTMGRDSTSQVISLRLDNISDEYMQNG